MVSRDPENLVGTELVGRYEIRSILGEGGMSLVYLGYHKLMQREVAIKVLQSSFKNHEPSKKRFLREARAASQLNHPNLITVYDFGITDDGLHYLVMNLIEGTSLAEILEKEVYLPPERAIPIFTQICEGLAHAHEHDVVHRDLKPENIMLLPERDGKEAVRVVDFGVAKLLARSGKPVERLTQSGEVFGTVLYLSPEQCTAKPVDARSDVYALGCVMYEVIGGLPPFMGENVNDTMEKHINELPKPPHEISDELVVPRQLSDIIIRCLAKNPDDRFQSMEELRRALQSALPGESPATVQDSPMMNSKGGKLLMLISSVAFCAVVLVTMLSFREIERELSGFDAPALLKRTDSEILNEAKLFDEQRADTVIRLTALAKLCHKEGRCEAAEKLLLRSVELCEKVNGAESPQALQRVSDLATFYMSMGDYTKAEPLLKRVMLAGKDGSAEIQAAAEQSKKEFSLLLRETNRREAAEQLDSQK